MYTQISDFKMQQHAIEAYGMTLTDIERSKSN
jgi:hypothetical protein